MIPLLHFFEQRGCAFCVAASLDIAAYEKKHRGSFILIRHRMDLMDYPIQGWLPEASPAYALVVEGTLLDTHIGVLDESGLGRFLGGKKKRKKVKPGSSQPVKSGEGGDDEDDEENVEQ